MRNGDDLEGIAQTLSVCHAHGAARMPLTESQTPAQRDAFVALLRELFPARSDRRVPWSWLCMATIVGQIGDSRRSVMAIQSDGHGTRPTASTRAQGGGNGEKEKPHQPSPAPSTHNQSQPLRALRGLHHLRVDVCCADRSETYPTKDRSETCPTEEPALALGPLCLFLMPDV